MTAETLTYDNLSAGFPSFLGVADDDEASDEPTYPRSRGPWYGFQVALTCAMLTSATAVSDAESACACLPEQGTSSAVIVEYKYAEHSVPVVAPIISEQVDIVMRAFSLTITQAARVLGVSRPTVYAWRKSSEQCNAEDPKHQRLLRCYQLATEWETRDLGPLGDLNLVPFEDDRRCILDYLTVENLDGSAVAKVRARLDLLANQPDDPRVAGHQALDWRESFRLQGFEDVKQEERDANFEDNLRRIRYEY